MNPGEKPDGYGKNTGACGDTVEVFLTLHGDRLSRVSFRINGCGHTLAATTAVARMAEGKTLQDAWAISVERVLEMLGDIPPEFEHCAELAVGALYLALANARELRQSPWKKLYGSA